MIPAISEKAQRYVEAIAVAIEEHHELTRLDRSFHKLLHVPGVQAINEMRNASNASINGIAAAAREAQAAGHSVINVGGDLIQVGDIIDAENIAIGHDIEQELKKTP